MTCILFPLMRCMMFCRFYATPEELSSLLQTVTSQIILACRSCICAPGKIWDQVKPPLIGNLSAAVELRDAYVTSFR